MMSLTPQELLHLLTINPSSLRQALAAYDGPAIRALAEQVSAALQHQLRQPESAHSTEQVIHDWAYQRIISIAQAQRAMLVVRWRRVWIEGVRPHTSGGFLVTYHYPHETASYEAIVAQRTPGMELLRRAVSVSLALQKHTIIEVRVIESFRAKRQRIS